MKKIIFKKQPIKFLKKQSKNDTERLLNAIYNLPDGDTKPLKGRHPLQRLRVGDFRVIFNEQNEVIQINKIGNRGDVYKQ